MENRNGEIVMDADYSAVSFGSKRAFLTPIVTETYAMEGHFPHDRDRDLTLCYCTPTASVAMFMFSKYHLVVICISISCT